MTADLSILADRVRAEIVGRGHIPTAVHDQTATDTVRIFWAQGAADTYIHGRLNHVLTHLAGPVQHSGAIHDARIALGEYDLWLRLERKAAA